MVDHPTRMLGSDLVAQAVAIPFDGEEEAVTVANRTRYGLAASIWHPDPTPAYELARLVRAGAVTVTGGGGGDEPLGTLRVDTNSRVSDARYADYGLLEYTQLKTVSWSAGRP